MMFQIIRFMSVSSVAAGLLLVTAGGSHSGPCPEIYDTVAVSGTLTFQGQPLEHYQVTFCQEGKRPSQGMTDSHGRFTLGTNATGDGAPPGKHKVTIVFAAESPLDIATSTAEQIMKSTPRPNVKIPTRYVSREKSDLEIEIPRNGSSDLRIELKS